MPELVGLVALVRELAGLWRSGMLTCVPPRQGNYHEAAEAFEKVMDLSQAHLLSHTVSVNDVCRRLVLTLPCTCQSSREALTVPWASHLALNTCLGLCVDTWLMGVTGWVVRARVLQETVEASLFNLGHCYRKMLRLHQVNTRHLPRLHHVYTRHLP